MKIGMLEAPPPKKFSHKQVLSEVRKIKKGILFTTDSKVYEAWADMAGDWLAGDNSDYLLDGFKGFNQRTGQEILADFHYNDRLLTPLAEVA